MLYSFSQFWLSHTLELAVIKTHQDKGTGITDTEQALEKQREYLNAASDSAIELLILVGLLVLFLKATKGEKVLNLSSHKIKSVNAIAN